MTPMTPMAHMTKPDKITVSVIGATGYAGGELCRLLSGHPGARLQGSYSSARAGKTGGVPVDGEVRPLDLEALIADRPGCVFLATPNDVSAELASRLLQTGSRVIDLSGAFRLRDAAGYPRWYGFPHPAPALLGEAVYGLTEWCDVKSGELAGARLVANPGCYATSILLALKPLMPLLDAGQPIVCDAKSGVSGAGRRSETAWSFAEVSGNFKAYGVDGHRHEPEIRQSLGLADEASFLFVPHLLPVVRGILSTLYLTFRAPVTAEDIAGSYGRAYAGSRFVKVLPDGALPEMKSVVGTPRCEIGFVLREQGRRAIVVSVIDNLLKGAASQAIQNFNRMFGFDDDGGLR